MTLIIFPSDKINKSKSYKGKKKKKHIKKKIWASGTVHEVCAVMYSSA